MSIALLRTPPRTPRSLAHFTTLASIPEESHSRSRKNSSQNEPIPFETHSLFKNHNPVVEKKKPENHTYCLLSALLITIVAIVLVALFILRLRSLI